MKKLVIISVIIFLFLGSSVYSQECAEDFKCPVESVLTPAYSRFFSSVTGNKFLAEKIAQAIIKKNIKKNAQGDFSVKLKSYSARDMKAGRFKSFEVEGKDVNFDGIYVSKFDLKTICDFNYINLDKDWNMTVIEDVPMSFALTITQDDLNKTMNSEEYKRLLGDIDLIGGGFFSIVSTNMRIKNDKLYYIIRIAVPFVRGTQDIVLCAGLKVVNGNIVFANAEFLNKDFALKADKLSRILNYINPLDFSVKILENKDAELNIKNVSVADNKISVDGTVVLLKDIIK